MGVRRDGHGQRSNAQQQGKEKTESRQEPEKGRRRAVAIRFGENAGRTKPKQQEDLISARGSIPDVIAASDARSGDAVPQQSASHCHVARMALWHLQLNR
jgi:hypothetical protein